MKVLDAVESVCFTCRLHSSPSKTAEISEGGFWLYLENQLFKDLLLSWFIENTIRKICYDENVRLFSKS